MTKISAPGCYEIDFETYLGDTCVGPSISAHGLSCFVPVELGGTQTPAHYWAHSPLNPNREEQKSTKAFDVGRAAHALVLGEPEFNRYFVVCPHEKLNANPGKQWNDEWKAKVEAGTEKRTLIRINDFDMVQRMAAAVKRSPQVARAFLAGKAELSFIFQDPETLIWVKSRPDWTPEPIPSGFLIDFKAHADIAPLKFSRDAFAFNYHLQAGLQFDACVTVTGEAPVGVAHVVQEKEPPFLAELRLFTPEQLDYGRRLRQIALRRFAECWTLHAAGKPERIAWPGYTTSPTYIETPFHIAKQMMETDNHGTDQDRDRREARDPADYLSA